MFEAFFGLRLRLQLKYLKEIKFPLHHHDFNRKNNLDFPPTPKNYIDIFLNQFFGLYFEHGQCPRVRASLFYARIINSRFNLPEDEGGSDDAQMAHSYEARGMRMLEWRGINHTYPVPT